MAKKDLTLYSGSPLRRMLEVSRLGDILDEFDKLWNCWEGDAKAFVDMQSKTSFPKVNVVETDNAYEIDVALAGFDKEDISMELKENCLCIKADKKEDSVEEDADKKYLMREISSRSFRRVLNFPKKVLTDNIECSFEGGVVKCVLQKKELPEPEKSVKIDIK
jgi:HSP20 family protein